ncbi:MAG: fatty acid desaturase family protein [Hyphomicrobiales bacterium]|nr:fatty acid desaturase family protein [Hyphomicrobiales bacterium]
MVSTKTDYSLTGPNADRAKAAGLVDAVWYSTPVPRPVMKQLMARRNGPAVRDTLIWILALATFGTLAYLSWGSWLAVPFFAIYGILYGSCGDSRWHECGHGTAFRTSWMNTAVYHVASFLILRNGTLWRWSHTRHHSDTIIVGRDPEITVERPPNLTGAILDLLYLRTGFGELGRMLRHVVGSMSPAEKDFVPESEQWKVFLEARIQFSILLATTLSSFYFGSILPLMFIGLPTFYGAWMDLVLFGYTQHAGLAEDVTDHRLNSRTVYLNPVFRFIYWNMNYHVEHHMFPMVPYHALPRLHAIIKDDCPPAYPNLASAWREILPTLWRQRHNANYFVKRPLPQQSLNPNKVSTA